jgi:hypothetical protein
MNFGGPNSGAFLKDLGETVCIGNVLLNLCINPHVPTRANRAAMHRGIKKEVEEGAPFNLFKIARHNPHIKALFREEFSVSLFLVVSPLDAVRLRSYQHKGLVAWPGEEGSSPSLLELVLNGSEAPTDG